jgi:hypothetical protein
VGDITTHIELTGNAGDAKKALEDVGGSAHEAKTAFADFKEELEKGSAEIGKQITAYALLERAVEGALEFVKEFTAESIKLAEAQETADRNLSLFAGNLTAAFKSQAEEFEKTYGVAAELTEKVQTLALAHGADRDQVLELTEATTKWAAITGTDAAGAAQQLVVAVEAGRHASRQLGIQWEETGDKSQDLKNAIDALNEKLAGADPTAEATLQGRTQRAAISFDNLKKAFGNWITVVESKAGVLDKLGGALDSIRGGLSAKGAGAIAGGLAYGPLAAVAGAGIGSLGENDIEPAPAQQNYDQQLIGSNTDEKTLAALKKANEAQAKEQQKSIEEKLKKDAEYWDKRGVTHQAEDAKENAEAERHSEELQAQEQAAYDKSLTDEQTAYDAQLTALKEEKLKEEEEVQKSQDRQFEINLHAWQKYEKARFKAQEEANKKLEDAEKQAAEEIGAVITNTITSTLQNAMNGQQQSWQDVAGSAASSILTIVGGIVGAYFGAPQLGGALGSLAGTAASYGIHQIKHEGGMVERYHAGGYPGTLGPNEQMIIAEAGEGVVDKRTMARMGGPGGLEQAKRGGGGGGRTVVIQAMDAQNVRDGFEGRLGRGMSIALRTGRGSLPRVVGLGR